MSSSHTLLRFLELNVMETLIGFLQSEYEEPEEVKTQVTFETLHRPLYIAED